MKWRLWSDGFIIPVSITATTWTAMEKHPKKMTCQKLSLKLKQEGLNDKIVKIVWGKKCTCDSNATMLSYQFPVRFVACTIIVLENGLDGELLWLMIEDYDELSAFIRDPFERLHLKKLVRKYSSTQPITRSDEALEVSINHMSVSDSSTPMQTI